MISLPQLAACSPRDDHAFGFFDRDYKARKAAIYLHNLTTILAHDAAAKADAATSNASIPARELNYSINNQPATIHDLLLQKSDGTRWLVVWNEPVKGTDTVTLDLDEERRGIQTYDPTTGVEPVTKHDRAKSLTMMPSNHPLAAMIPRWLHLDSAKDTTANAYSK